jgi:hypothetical protein
MWEYTGDNDSNRHSAKNLMREELTSHVLAITVGVRSDFLDESGPLPFNQARLKDLVSSL